MTNLLKLKIITSILSLIAILFFIAPIANAAERLIGTCPDAEWIPPSNRGKSYSVADPTEATALCCAPTGGPTTEWTEEKINACAAALFPAAERGFAEVEAQRPVEFPSPIGRISPAKLIGKIIKTALGVIGAVALLMFVYGGLMWMTSGGSPERIKKAQTILVWAVLGLTVIFASYTIVDQILITLGS